MKLEIIKEIDTKEKRWCDSAVLIEISGGRGALTTINEKIDYNNLYANRILLLNNKPIIQNETAYCGTCAGLLARGCGIEKTDTPELAEIRNRINAPFVDLYTSIKNIKPVLGLLDDGYYLIADAILYPTDGNDRFFMNVPDNETIYDATSGYYFSDDCFSGTDGFPAYIYPTQSNACFDIERAKYYLDTVDKENTPRAIAYYYDGFMCALLDGHHKAYAAALKGVMLKTLLIVPVTGYSTSKVSKKFIPENIMFSDIVVPMNDRLKYKPFKPFIKKKLLFENYKNSPVTEDDLSIECYPSIDEIAVFLADGLDKIQFTDELIYEWVSSDNMKHKSHLKYALMYFAKTDIQKAIMIAKMILESDNFAHYLKETAMRFIVRHKSDESEQIAIDYIIDHEPNDPIYKIADGYWC